MSASDLRAAFEAAFSPKVEPVTLPGLSNVFVRPISAGAMSVLARRREDPHAVGVTLAYCLCDADGKRLFDPDNAADTAWLSDLDWEVVNPITQKINAISGLGPKAEEEAKNG